MALFNPHSGQGSRSMLMMRVFTAQLLGLLACLANTALAQFDVSEAVTASASFPAVGITCIGNLAVFFSCLIRGRLHVEMGARDLLATITGSKLRKRFGANGARYLGSIDPDVVMLSNHTPESSTRQFMEYIRNTHDVASTLLQFYCYAKICNGHTCSCIVIEGTDTFIKLCLARRMPGVFKQLSDSACLLPCLTCLTNVCHGCNHGMLHAVEETLTEGDPKEWPVPAVCEILDKGVTTECEERSCICIPWRQAEDDVWTEMLIRSLKTKDKVDRGVTNPASDALGKYISQSGVCDETEEDRLSFQDEVKSLILSLLVMTLEIACIISGSAVLATLGIEGFGRWTYSAIQLLVWIKWGLGSCVYSYDRYKRLARWAHDVSAGHGLMCASAFLLNAILAGVRGQWKYSQS